MIVVKIELWSAITHKATEIGRMYIANDSSGNIDRGNYDVAVCKRGTTHVPQEMAHDNAHPKATRTGKVMDYPRVAYNVWRLITRACLASFPEELRSKPGKMFKTALHPHVMQGLARIVADWIEWSKDRGIHGTGDDTIKAALDWLTASIDVE